MIIPNVWKNKKCSKPSCIYVSDCLCVYKWLQRYVSLVCPCLSHFRKPPYGGFHKRGTPSSLDGWFHGKSHLFEWMMLFGVPLWLRKPPYLSISLVHSTIAVCSQGKKKRMNPSHQLKDLKQKNNHIQNMYMHVYICMCTYYIYTYMYIYIYMYEIKNYVVNILILYSSA